MRVTSVILGVTKKILTTIEIHLRKLGKEGDNDIGARRVREK